ncbi:MAG: pyruvate formate-lyase 1-activating enzyme [Tenericutes bacterium HGW-Tenericutes-8]|nr:MAG: pyruvate formate-lyase 1-activating enzyme [Tenericutes bacterium HGW-Tenericutes-8]
MNPSKFLNVHSIETMGAFDGPGIRYVLFLQGCPFKCQYCHNRDTWDYKVNKSKTVEEIFIDFNKYKSFYKHGGITVSGGEPLLQIDMLIDLFKLFKSHGIHTCIDTSGATFNPQDTKRLDELMQYTDLVLLDIKHIDDEAHKVLVGASNKNVIQFARYLNDINKSVYIRHVLLPNITGTTEQLTKLRTFLDTLTNVKQIDILPYHKKGIQKWAALKFDYPLLDLEEPSKELIYQAHDILKTCYVYQKTSV